MTKIKNSTRSPVVFMTGGTSGLGKITAIEIAASGAHLLVLARNSAKAQSLLEDFKNNNNPKKGKITIVEGDLNSLRSLKSALNEVGKKFPIIDSLALNAGIMNFEYRETEDNMEETFQVNFISHLLICHYLLPNLKKSNAAKIIFTASGLHRGTIHFENLFFKNNFSSFRVYSQSKLAIILICKLLANPLEKINIGIYCQHPGMVRTELGARAGWLSRIIFYLMGSSVQKGSRTLTYLLKSNKSTLQSGAYYKDKKVTSSSRESHNMVIAEQLQSEAVKLLRPHLNNTSIILPYVESNE